MTDNGLITLASHHAVGETIGRLETSLNAKGMAIFARIDHAAAADGAGLQLRPTLLLIFGSPGAGTPLMQAGQTIGIDLPLKALAWEDGDGQVWLTYNDPRWLARRHGLDARVGTVLDGMAAALTGLAEAAAS